ncbi:SRPBCC family protein [Dyella sedimenti]|uniref:SRPBCC family protein n=1 Tax=Dyella sedimenti TaxID=2919947 RepID=UPI001FAB2C06|nr:SRPBCC family protein [Dyella sedimenti]
MKFSVEKTFPMPGSSEAAWALLQNVEDVAGCMPGATITERVDDSHYKGTVSVKLGPASLVFKGDIEVAGIDAATRTLHLVGKGADATGTSGASMDLLASVQSGDSPASCQLVGKSDVSVSGKAATFGGRMMGSVTEQILQQFARNFAAEVARQAPAAPAQEAGEKPAPPPAKGRELNAFALFWAVVRDWFRHLFGRRGSA